MFSCWCVIRTLFKLILCVGSGKQEIYFMALIDVLTKYSMKKRTAQAAKTVKHGAGAEISTVRPDQYARRFLDFISKCMEWLHLHIPCLHVSSPVPIPIPIPCSNIHKMTAAYVKLMHTLFQKSRVWAVCLAGCCHNSVGGHIVLAVVDFRTDGPGLHKRWWGIAHS